MGEKNPNEENEMKERDGEPKNEMMEGRKKRKKMAAS